jgi:hypothetical protein
MREPEGMFRDAPAPRARRLAALNEPVLVRKLWAGRSHSVAIVVSLVTRDGKNLAQVELWRVDSAGRLHPTAMAIPLAIARLSELSAALVTAHRRAIELHLIEHWGPKR